MWKPNIPAYLGATDGVGIAEGWVGVWYLCKKSFSCREAVEFVLVSHLEVCEDDTEIWFSFYFSLEMLVIFMEIFMPVLSHFGFLTHSFSFANPLSSFFSVLIIPEREDNFTDTLGLILSGLVIFQLPVSPWGILYPWQIAPVPVSVCLTKQDELSQGLLERIFIGKGFFFQGVLGINVLISLPSSWRPWIQGNLSPGRNWGAAPYG